MLGKPLKPLICGCSSKISRLKVRFLPRSPSFFKHSAVAVRPKFRGVRKVCHSEISTPSIMRLRNNDRAHVHFPGGPALEQVLGGVRLPFQSPIPQIGDPLGVERSAGACPAIYYLASNLSETGSVRSRFCRVGIDQMTHHRFSPPQVLFQHQASNGRCYFFRTIEAASPLACLFHPWKREKSPAFHASRSPGVLRSQSGRISVVTARRSCQRSTTDGRPQNQ